MNEEYPLVSVVVINWNHGDFLSACLDALLAQEYPAFEIIVIDNDSTDNSLEGFSSRFPAVRLVRNAQNVGFARALNQAIRLTQASLIISLNPDVTVRSGFLMEMARASRQADRVGMVAPRLLRAHDPRLLDSTGLFVNRQRRPWERGQGQLDHGQYDGGAFVFGACGGAALYKREMLQDVCMGEEFFDEDFFAYYEDVDLAWRAQSRGWQAVYAPQAAATHVRGSGDTLRKCRQSGRGPRLALRNRYLTALKNDSLAGFVLDLPWILAAEFPRLVYTALVCPGVLLGIVDFFRLLPGALQKRRLIANRRTVNPSQLRNWLLVKDLT